MPEIVLPRGSPCHIISLLSYQVQIKPAALAVNAATEQTRSTLCVYQRLIEYCHHPTEGAHRVILWHCSTAS